LIDYPYDSGCLNKEDNIELDAPIIITPTGNEDLNNSASESEQVSDEEDVSSLESDFEIDFVFWISLTLLVGGIIVAWIMIMRSMRKHKRLKELQYVPNYKEIKL